MIPESLRAEAIAALYDGGLGDYSPDHASPEPLVDAVFAVLRKHIEAERKRSFNIWTACENEIREAHYSGRVAACEHLLALLGDQDE